MLQISGSPSQEQKRIFNPLIVATLHAGIYILLALLYIWGSSTWASKIAPSVDALKDYEVFKGFIFVGVSGLFFFFCSWRTLKKIAKNETEIIVQKNALIQSEQRALAGIFASSIAHDMNNVLTILKGHVYLLETEENMPLEVENPLTHIIKAVEDLTDLAKQLGEAGKEGGAGKIETTDIVSLLNKICESAEKHGRVKRCSLSFSMPDELRLGVNQASFKRMMLNLIINAADALQGEGKIEIKVEKKNTTVTIEVHDNGPGVPQGKENVIFTPLYTSKKGGAGLGLLSVKTCVSEHNGEVSVHRSELGGACFRVNLPLDGRAE